MGTMRSMSTTWENSYLFLLIDLTRILTLTSNAVSCGKYASRPVSSFGLSTTSKKITGPFYKRL